MTSAFSLCDPNSQACDSAARADSGVKYDRSDRCDQHMALQRDFLITTNAVQYNTQPPGGMAAAVTPRTHRHRTALGGCRSRVTLAPGNDRSTQIDQLKAVGRSSGSASTSI